MTDQLEGKLGDLRQELDQVVNRVTAEALKTQGGAAGPDQGDDRGPAGGVADDRGGGVAEQTWPRAARRKLAGGWQTAAYAGR